MMFTVNNKLGMGGCILLFMLLHGNFKKNETFSFSPNLGTTLQFLLKKKYTFYTSFDFFLGGRAFFNVPSIRPVRF